MNVSANYADEIFDRYVLGKRSGLTTISKSQRATDWVTRGVTCPYAGEPHGSFLLKLSDYVRFRLFDLRAEVQRRGWRYDRDLVHIGKIVNAHVGGVHSAYVTLFHPNSAEAANG